MSNTIRLRRYITEQFSTEINNCVDAMEKFQTAYNESSVDEIKQIYSAHIMAKAQMIRILENLKTDLLLNLIVNQSTVHPKEEIKDEQSYC